MTEHGIGDFAIAAKYKLGVVAEPLPGDEMFQGMLSIPYLGPDGQVSSMKYRNLSGHGGKYLYPFGTKHRLYNSQAKFAADHVIGVAEGEIDAIAATERLDVPTFGVPSVDAWTKMEDVWTPIFKDFRLVLIFADGDQPGKDMAKSIAEAVGGSRVEARIIQCPDGMDVASMIHMGRTKELTEKCQLVSA